MCFLIPVNFALLTYTYVLKRDKRGRRSGRPVTRSNEKLAAITEALNSGTSNAVVCRTFGVKRMMHSKEHPLNKTVSVLWIRTPTLMLHFRRMGNNSHYANFGNSPFKPPAINSTASANKISPIKRITTLIVVRLKRWVSHGVVRNTHHKIVVTAIISRLINK